MGGTAQFTSKVSFVNLLTSLLAMLDASTFATDLGAQALEASSPKLLSCLKGYAAGLGFRV